MITDTKDKIIEYIRYHGQARAKDIYETFKISRVAAHKQLHKLLEEGLVIRVGKPPIVFYTFPQSAIVTKTNETELLSQYSKQIIDNNFLSITPDGRLLYGITGFIDYVQNYQKNMSIESIANEYVEIVQTQKKLFTINRWIDATSKLTETFKETPITRLLFEDIYSYRVFGRTKLAKMVMYAKQTGERSLMDKISDMAKPIVENIIKKYHIEAVSFIPPTVPRPLQFMDELESRLQLSLPKIELVKLTPGDIPIPQKTLASLNERIINAKNSIYIKNNKEYKYENILLIDDVVGSGASFNETAKKLRNSNIGYGTIVAFGLVGNIKGYDVIREI